MTDVIGTLAKIVCDWNEEQKCCFFWEFTASLRESDLNEYQQKAKGVCPVLVAVTNYRIECQTPLDRRTGLQTLGAEIHTFDLHFLLKDNVGVNVYNEIKDHPLRESKWATILKPLADCIACSPLDFCEYLGYDMEVVRWSLVPRMDWQDNNYSGWTVNVQLRQNNVG